MMVQEEHVGRGSALQLGDIVARFSPKAMLLVHGKDSYVQCGAAAVVQSATSRHPVLRVSDFSTNPQIDDVQRILGCLAGLHFDLILAVGGGSVIDMAKLLCFHQVASPGSGNTDSPSGLSSPGRIPPIVAVPTTAGTGSEATCFAVVYELGIKQSIESPHIFPAVAVVDPCFTDGCPRYVSATAGADALSQAIESHWSIRSSEESRRYSAEAIPLIHDNLISAVVQDKPDARARVALGAHLAGKAINISRTTAPHAFSYAFTSRHGLPHGHACALTLPFFLEQMGSLSDASCRDPRGVAFTRSRCREIAELLGASSAPQAADHLRVLLQTLGLEHSVSQLGLKTPGALEGVLSEVNPDRLGNHPQTVDVRALEGYLHT